jgi:hypothetical protein
LNFQGWQALARQREVAALAQAVHARVLLSLSLGLFLGGSCLWLLGWRLRPAAP